MIKDLELQLENKSKEFAEMQQKLESIIKEQNNEIKRLKEENQKLQMNKEIDIFDIDAIHEYETIENIGNNGQVVKVGKKNIYTLKTINLKNQDSDSFQNFIKNVQIMNSNNHPNILKTYKIFYRNETTKPSVLLEYCKMNLDQLIKNKSLSKPQTISLIYQIAEGMKYIHFRNIIHGNLKPTNILIGLDGKIKISDLKVNICSDSSNEDDKRFMAPEIIRNDQNCTEKVDVFSFGSLIFFILSEGNLIDDSSNILSTFAPFAQQLIKKCWNAEPKERPSFITICAEMNQNNFEFVHLSNIESQEVRELVEQHKKQIPLFI